MLDISLITWWRESWTWLCVPTVKVAEYVFDVLECWTSLFDLFEELMLDTFVSSCWRECWTLLYCVRKCWTSIFGLLLSSCFRECWTHLPSLPEDNAGHLLKRKVDISFLFFVGQNTGQLFVLFMEKNGRYLLLSCWTDQSFSVSQFYFEGILHSDRGNLALIRAWSCFFFQPL